MKKYFVSKVRHFCNISVDKCCAMKERTIDFYDLTFVLGGNMTYIIEGKTITLKKNDAIFLKPGCVNSRLDGAEHCEYVSFNFYLLPDVKLDFETFIPGCISRDIKTLLSAFPQSHISPYYHSEEKLANMLNYILLELSDIVSIRSSNEHIHKILNYIELHIRDKMSLESISKNINLSKEYTATIFKKETGKTLVNYINERKMMLAKELIISNEMSLVDVSNHLGYDNYNYFSRLFKKHFDVTPVYFKNK